MMISCHGLLLGQSPLNYSINLEDKNNHSISITFISDNECSQRVVSKEETLSNGRGRQIYIFHSDLGHNTAKNCQYLKDDHLYFTVSVDVKSSTPWLIKL